MIRRPPTSALTDPFSPYTSLFRARRRPTARHAHAGERLTLRVGYRPPYDLESMLGFLRGRALPGVEHVGDDSYARVIAGDGAGAPPGWLDRKSTRLNSSH